jgi:hypothetical protein
MTEQKLKIESIEKSGLIFLSSALDRAPVFSPRSEIFSPKVHFSAAC